MCNALPVHGGDVARDRMCGIFAIFGSPKSDDALRKVAIKCAKKLRHRGPDWSGCYCKARLSAVAARPPPVSHTRASREARCSNRTGWQRTRVSFWPQDGVAIVHERLAIVDPESGAQPMYSNDRTIVLGVNGDRSPCRTSPALLREAPSATGEIWNHRAIRAETKGALGAHKYATQSDCEVPLPAPGTTLVTCASRSASVAPVNPQGAKQGWAGHHPTVPGVRLGPRRPSRRHVRLRHVTRYSLGGPPRAAPVAGSAAFVPNASIQRRLCRSVCLGLRSCRAFVRYNEAKKEYVIARDHLGKCPLYFGHANDGRCGPVPCSERARQQRRGSLGAEVGGAGPFPAQMCQEGSIHRRPR